jgi:chitinase
MDVTGAGTANGTKVQIYACKGTSAQAWTVGANNSLVNTNSGKCLDATGQSSADGTRLQIWSCTGTANQSWTLSS